MSYSIKISKLILLISFTFSAYSTFCEPCCCCKKNVKPNLGNSGNSGSSRLINKGGLGEDKKKKDEGEEKSEDKNSVSEENKSEGEEESDSKSEEEKSEDKKSENSVAGKEESNADESKENKSWEAHSKKSKESKEDSKLEDLSTKEKPMKKKKKPTEDNIIKSIKGYIDENLIDIDFEGIASILNKEFKEELTPEFEVCKNDSMFICVECSKCTFFSKYKIDSLIKSYTVPEEIIFDEMWLYVHDSGRNYIKITDDYTLGDIVSSLCRLPKELRPYWNHHYLKLKSEFKSFIKGCAIYFDITDGVFYYKDKIENFSSSDKLFYRDNKKNYGLFCINDIFSINPNGYSNGYFVYDDYNQPEESSRKKFSKSSKNFGYVQLKKKKALESFHIVS